MEVTDFSFGWDDQGKNLLFMENVSVVQTGFRAAGEMRATPAYIIPSGQSKPLKICTSGWRPQQKPYDVLDGNKWTELVRQFSDAVGFCLPSHIRDVQNTNDPEMRAKNEGRFFACHAEKKLGLFFLTRQVKNYGLSLEEALRGKLRDLNLPLSDRCATILLGHKPCKNCLDFLHSIRHKTGIDVKTQSCSVFDRHVKRRGFYDSAQNQNAGTRPAARPAETSDEDTDQENMEMEDREVWDEDPSDRSSRASSSSEDLVPLPAGNLRRTRTYLDDDADDELEELLHEEESEVQAEPELPSVPVNRDTGRQPSVFSTPSPSIPSSSLPGSSPAPRHLRFGPYLGSPPRIGGTGSPPAHWGPRGKPPPKPCFRPPPSLGGPDQDNENENDANRASAMEPSSRASSALPGSANQASYFFGSPSPEAEDRSEPRMTLRASVIRKTPPANGVGGRPELQVIIRREPVDARDMRPPPPPRPAPSMPAREESADVEILGSRKRRAPNCSTGSPVTKRLRENLPEEEDLLEEEDDDDVQIYNPYEGWQPASAKRTRPTSRPFGMVPPVLRPGNRRREIPVVNLSAPADSPRPAFTCRPHPMPFMVSMTGRRLRRQEPARQQRSRVSHRSRAAPRTGSSVSQQVFPNLQVYRYEV